jgi:hypothetical protein
MLDHAMLARSSFFSGSKGAIVTLVRALEGTIDNPQKLVIACHVVQKMHVVRVHGGSSHQARHVSVHTELLRMGEAWLGTASICFPVFKCYYRLLVKATRRESVLHPTRIPGTDPSFGGRFCAMLLRCTVVARNLLVARMQSPNVVMRDPIDQSDQ